MAPRDRIAEKIVQRDADGRQARREEEALWRDIGRLVIPRRARFSEEVSPGVERVRQVLDSTAPRALELFAAFLFAILANPASQWVGIEGEEEEPEGAMAAWYSQVSRIFLRKMSSRTTNLYPHLHTSFMDLGAFGTDNLYVREHRGDLLVRAQHLGDCVPEENEFGFVDAMTRQEFLFPRQAIQRWGSDDLGRSITDVKERQKEPVRFLHGVYPVDDPDIQEDLRDIDRAGRFVQFWVNAQDRKTVERGPMPEFPYITSRWSQPTNHGPYGRSPAMTVLPDIRMTNRMMETILRGVEKLVDPPLLLPDGGLVSPLRLFPGGISFADGNIKPEPLIPPGASRIDLGEVQLEKRREAIRDGFFVPLFVTPDSPVKTATQVLQEVDERNKAAAPMLIRVQAEKFQPFIARSFNVMARNGMFPPPPRDIAPGVLRARYVSPLLSAQRQVDSLNLLRLAEALGPWADADPTTLDNFNTDEIARVLHRAQAADPQVLRSKSAVSRLRQGRAQANAEASQVEQAEAVSKAALNVAQADQARRAA